MIIDSPTKQNKTLPSDPSEVDAFDIALRNIWEKYITSEPFSRAELTALVNSALALMKSGGQSC